MDKSFTEIPELPGYFINRKGEVFSSKSNRLLTPYLEESGYYRYYFCINNKQVRILLHRLLANVYLDLPSIYSPLEVDHIDTNRQNNKVNSNEDTNLQVLTRNEHKNKTCLDHGYNRNNTFNKVCFNCGGVKSLSHHTSKCSSCNDIDKRKEWPSLDEIDKQVRETSWVQAAKFYGVSDNGLRKRYKALGGDPSTLTKSTRV